ncbi:MAG TPA: hypothetical protein VNU64_11095 [Burkholderiales bacterium]|nr:hypothetical protein [Burkholderiales bacterium]
MQAKLVHAALLTSALVFSAAATAQSASQERPSSQQYGEGGSKHCDQLSGTEKEQCMQDEGAKTDRKEEPAATPSSSASGASSSEGRDTAPDAKGDNATQKND